MPSLPPPSWLTLPEVIAWLVERGISEADAKSALPRAFRDGDIRTRGRSRFALRNNEIHSELPADLWHGVRVNWEKNRISSIPGKLYADSTRSFPMDVEVSRADLVNWINRNEIHDASGRKSDEASASRRGRRPKYDWPSFYAEIAVMADLDALPETQAELERYMAQWCENNWGKEPSESMLRQKISPIYDHPRKAQH